MRALAASLLPAALTAALSAAPVLAAPAPASAPASARADSAARASAAPARADSAAHRAKPFGVMLRAAVAPGWGQFYNRKYVKGIVVIAGEGFLGYKAWKEFRLEQDAVDRAAAIGSTDYAGYQAALEDRSLHENKKITWIWWGVAAHLLQMTDAYVDAHLASFEADFGPPEGSAGSGAGATAESPRFTLALRKRF